MISRGQMYRQLYMGGGIGSLDAGAPSIKYTGDIKPQMASNPDPMAELYNMFLDLKQQGQIPKEMGFEQFKQLMEEQTSMSSQQPMMAANGGRMHYGLGSIFKGVKKAVKGIGEGISGLVKSDVGKAALLGLGAYGLGGGFGSAGFSRELLGQRVMSPINFLREKFTSILPTAANETIKKTTGTGMDLAMLSILGAGAAAGTLARQPDESDEQYKARVQALTPQLRKNWQSLNPMKEEESPQEYQAREDAFVLRATGEYNTSFNTGGRVGYALGDPDPKMDDLRERVSKLIRELELKQTIPSMRLSDMEKPDPTIESELKRKIREDLERRHMQDIIYQDAIKKNSKKAYGGRMMKALGDTAQMAAGIEGLPFRQNQAGVGEIDMRETGGFIPPVGIKEKADDIPAMLSNNEFVFTADAVRGMGGGDVELGSQRMYDMMKKLEKGGRV